MTPRLSRASFEGTDGVARLLGAAGLAFLVATIPAATHEFWLDPVDYRPAPSQSVPISIRIGQNFKGNSFPYLREEIRRFVVVDARGERPVKGVDGDDPAVTPKLPAPGLAVLAHYSTAEMLTFETWDEFDAYLRLEGLEHVADLHRAQGKPTAGVVETYARCAKLLLDVGGGGTGADRATGMPLELVAEKNPYALAAGEPLPLRLFYGGRPIAGVLVTAFAKAAPDRRQRARTDADGRVTIDLPSAGPWLVNAVHMRAPPPGGKAHWDSLWASLTFARP